MEAKLVHLQITKKCNLRCWFCGQWGKKGFFADSSGEEMKFSDWEKVIAELVELRRKTGNNISVILWGGEPLTSPIFDETAELLCKNDFPVGAVTNGTLINEHAEILKNKFTRVYVSIDGNREVHNKIRGEGVFEKAAENLKMIHGGKAKISLMSVISPDNIDILDSLPETLLALPCDELILQDMIYMTASEINEYKTGMKEVFGINAAEIDSWGNEDADKKKKEQALRKIFAEKYPKPVIYLPHNSTTDYCRSAFWHIHIAWNGNVLYCTDFYDFSAGNVKKESLLNIVDNELSEKFREEIKNNRCVTCRHCSWRLNHDFTI